MRPRHKYNIADKSQRIFNGKTYDSKAEREYAEQLWMLRLDGEVIDYVEQPRYRLGCPENVYVADFFVVPADGDCYCVDVKGMQTAKFKRDKALWRRYGWCLLVVIVKTGRVFRISERIAGDARIHIQAGCSSAPSSPSRSSSRPRRSKPGSDDTAASSPT